MSVLTDDELSLLEADRIYEIKRVTEERGIGDFAISFSGGRDSTALSALWDVALPGNDTPRVFCDTGIELNEVRNFVRECAESDPRVVMVKPSANVMDSLRCDGYPFKSKEHSQIWQIWARNGDSSKTYRRYMGEGRPNGRFCCPDRLRYQFTGEYLEHGLPISDKCCKNLKERPFSRWMRESGRHVRVTGVMASEGGRRASARCLSYRNGRLAAFNPFAPVPQEFVDYVVCKYDVRICRLYYGPFNFRRTGCKGCPFDVELQDDLDVLERFFPAERRQCERVFGPVYDEYRRIGYRLREEADGKAGA